MRKFLPLLLLWVFITTSGTHAQSCFNIFAGNDTTVSCLQTCIDLKARIPDIKSTEDYQVISIPYNPYPYVTTAPAFLHPCLAPITGQDDKYVDTSYIPFNFCFYGMVTNKFVISTNGLISFDLFNALHGSNYNVSNPIPFIGTGDSGTGVCPIPNGAPLYPKLAIMGAFEDIFPDVTDPDYKIEARVEGSAPCRKFVLSFFNVRLYNCQTKRSTFEIVLHEGTGLIDIFIADKPFCSAPGSNTIIGIQKDGTPGSPFASPPGRNLFTQTVTNEGWRFVPSGPTSLVSRAELYKNGTLISTATLTPLGNGELEALFSNVCQTEDSMSYVVKAFYKQCDNPALETEASDTMIVYKTLNPINTNSSNVLCKGTSTGKVTVTSPLAANIEYSIDAGVTWQTSPVFNVPAGSYTVQARIIGTLCGGKSAAVTITEPTVLTAISTPSDANCAGNTGSITVSAAGGSPVYQYSINNGASYQASNQFLNLPPGTYNLVVKDANGCLKPFTQAIALNDTMRLELGTDTTICFGNKIILLPQTNPETNIFKWTPAAGLDYDTAKNPLASPNDTTKYYLTARWGLCQRKDSITVKVLHKPIADAGKDTSVCYKTNALLVGNATNLSGTVNYLWAPPDSLNSPNARITIARMDTTRKFILTVTDNYGCNFSVTDSVWVTMMPPLLAFAGNDTNAIIGKPHQLQASGGTNYVWSPAMYLNDPFISNPLAILYNDTYFTVQVTDAIGCTASDGVFIKVYEGPNYYVPNAFTPNGDGLNDVFRPVPVGIQSTEYFRVFNRFGELMFQTNKWLDGWDGTLKGKKAEAGTYTWMIKGVDKNGKIVEMQGTVILIR